MKRIIFLLLLICTSALAKATLSDNEKLASLGKVWGLLKYYHPKVARGKLDWDKEMMDHVAPILAAHNREELSRVYLDWINGLGAVTYKPGTRPLPDSFKNYLDVSWIDNKNIFTDSLSTLLHAIQQNSKLKRNYYAHRMLFGLAVLTLRQEHSYKDSILPSPNMRLLALFRYWNIVNYFYPYKNILDENLNNVLDEMVPVFRATDDTISYHMALRQVIAKLDDSHAALFSTYTRQYFGGITPPILYRIIENKVIVSGFYNDSLARLDDLQYGDIITSVDGKTIPQIIEQYRKYIGASNEPALILRYSFGVIFAGHQPTCTISYERNGVSATKIIHRYPFSDFHFVPGKNISHEASAILKDNVGYVNMGVLTKKHVKPVMKSLKGTNAIIFDVRNYPNGTIYKVCKYLKPEKSKFARFTIQARKKPGVFRNFSQTGCGRKNRNYYKGKVIVLFDETTQSHAEFTCMAFQTVPGAKCIGSQTSGADGNVIKIILPGGVSTLITGLGTFYPNGRPTQRIGIVPDITVTPTLEGIRMHTDEVLDRAMEYVKTGK